MATHSYPAEIQKHVAELKVNNAAKKEAKAHPHGITRSHANTHTHIHTHALYSYLFMKLKGLSPGQLGRHSSQMPHCDPEKFIRLECKRVRVRVFRENN